MAKTYFGVYGASGCGREVMATARKNLQAIYGASDYELVFIDDNPAHKIINNHSVFNFEEFLNADAAEHYVTIAIANSAIREELNAKCCGHQIKTWDITADNCVIMGDVSIGEGFILYPFVTLTSNIKIGRCFHANLYSYVGHDCVIGDYVTFAPSVKCNGNVEIGDHAYIGTGAIIKQGKPGPPLRIGQGAKVGAGAVVTKDVPEGATVFGNPAALLTKENLRKR